MNFELQKKPKISYEFNHRSSELSFEKNADITSEDRLLYEPLYPNPQQEVLGLYEPLYPKLQQEVFWNYKGTYNVHYVSDVRLRKSRHHSTSRSRQNTQYSSHVRHPYVHFNKTF